MTAAFAANCPWKPPRRRRDAQARLAAALDELRQSRGHPVIHARPRLRPPGPGEDAGLGWQGAHSVRAAAGRGLPALPSPLPSVTHCPWPMFPFARTAIIRFSIPRSRPPRLSRWPNSTACPPSPSPISATCTARWSSCRRQSKPGSNPSWAPNCAWAASPLLLYVESARGYHNLCRLLSRKAEDGNAPGRRRRGRAPARSRYPCLSAAKFRLPGGVDRRQRGHPAGRDVSPPVLLPLSPRKKCPREFPAAACPAIHYATPDDRRKYDIVQSIRTLTLLRQAHPEKRRGGRFHFRAPAEMAAGLPGTSRLAAAHAWRSRSGATLTSPSASRNSRPSRRRTAPGRGNSCGGSCSKVCAERYGTRADKFHPQVTEELGIINEVGYEEYFLITWDFLQECRRRGIEWITRGSAADSLVCYCLGISGVCPDPLRSLFPPLSQQGAHGAAQTARTLTLISPTTSRTTW